MIKETKSGMRAIQQFSIMQPLELANIVEGKISSGGFASASAVLRYGMPALIERDAGLDR